jgi:hypothetical protein
MDTLPEGRYYLVPLRLDEFRIPERLAHLHFGDVFDDAAMDRFVAKLGQYGIKPSPRGGLEVQAPSFPLSRERLQTYRDILQGFEPAPPKPAALFDAKLNPADLLGLKPKPAEPAAPKPAPAPAVKAAPLTFSPIFGRSSDPYALDKLFFEVNPALIIPGYGAAGVRLGATVAEIKLRHGPSEGYKPSDAAVEQYWQMKLLFSRTKKRAELNRPKPAAFKEFLLETGDPTEYREGALGTYHNYFSKGLAFQVVADKVSRIILYGGDEPGYSRFPGKTPEGVCVDSRRSEVEAAYGPGQAVRSLFITPFEPEASRFMMYPNGLQVNYDGTEPSAGILKIRLGNPPEPTT